MAGERSESYSLALSIATDDRLGAGGDGALAEAVGGDVEGAHARLARCHVYEPASLVESTPNLPGHQQEPNTKASPRPDTASKTKPENTTVTDVLSHHRARLIDPEHKT